MPLVNVQGVGQVNFPDSMSEQDIQAAIERDILPGIQATATTSPSRLAGQQQAPWKQALATAGQGLTFGFYDELAGALGALASPTSPIEGYKTQRDYVRGMGDQFQKEHPILAPTVEVGSSMAWGGPLVAGAKAILPKAATTLQRIGQSIGTGGVLGGIGGAGTAEDVASIPGSAGKGAAWGAAASGVLEPVAMVARGVKNAVMPYVPYFGGSAAREAALGRVANAITQDDKTAPMVAARLGKLGSEGRIADAAGQSTRDLLDTMATLPGATRNQTENMLRARRATAPARIDEAIAPLTGGARAAPTLEALQKTKEAAAKPLYAAVENTLVPITPKLEDLMRRPAFQEAFDQAVTNAANRGQQLPMLEDLLKAGPVAGVKVRFWDDVKRALDDVISAKKRGLDTRTPANKNRAQSTLSSTLDTKHELVNEIDTLTQGAYKQARDAYAGPAALQSALQDGLEVWTMKAGELREAMAKMSASERDAFRIGAGEALREKAGSPSGQTQLLNAWKDRNLREKLQEIYGSAQEYHKALSVLLREERLRRLEGAGRGSQTARREAGVEDFNLGTVADAAQAAQAAAKGSFSGLLDAARKTYSRMATPESVRDEVGRILLQGGPQARTEISALEQMIENISRRNAGQAAFTGLLGGAVPRF